MLARLFVVMGIAAVCCSPTATAFAPQALRLRRPLPGKVLCARARARAEPQCISLYAQLGQDTVGPFRSGSREEPRPGRRAVLRGAASLGVATAFSGEASAKKTKEKPCAPGMCVKASSPGIALDMIITMKAAKAMREAGEQLEAGEFKALDTWLTNAFASNSFAFIKKTKVLESLATSLLGVSVADDFEDDPSFNSEESIDSKQVSLSLSLSLARTSALFLTINVLFTRVLHPGL